ncbi:hypothetical protein [Sinimarinibacterium thermocellulolyticum]|uniref:Membrane protein involved in the export of O-antigen and teichoic acid n=1 Tax=Sinimarinibacterium thermocellulolyticum TaxID=3170016 RepID=A0ABV2A5H5_9GAMM
MLRTTNIALFDQCIWSVTNFLAVALFAHVASPEEFGQFSLAFTVTIFVSGLAAALSGEVLAVARVDLRAASKNDRPPDDQFFAQKARAAGITAMLAMVGAIAVSVVMVWFAGNLTVIGVWVAVTAPAAIWAEGMRAMAYAQRKTRVAFLISSAWLAGQGLATLIVGLGMGRLDHTAVLTGWFCGAMASAVASSLATAQRLQFRGATRAEWRRRCSFGLEYAVTAGTMNLTVVLAAAFVGVVEAGLMRALQTAFGPVNVLMVSIRNVVVPVAAELYRGHRLWNVSVQATLAVGGANALMWFLLATFPDLGRLIMDENWPADAGVVSGFSLLRLAAAAIFGALVVFRALDVTRLSVRLHLLSSGLLIITFSAYLQFGLEPALWAAGAAYSAAAALWWLIARRLVTTSVA